MLAPPIGKAKYEMKSTIPQYLRVSTLALTTVLFALPCVAQNYPERPVRFIVPLPPGGGADIVARVVAQKLSEGLGQQVVVDNRGGGGTVIGAQAVARAAPDGYTLLLNTATTHAINPVMAKDLPYDAIKDFSPVSLIANLPVVLVAHPSLGVNNVSELVALAKSKPGALHFASSGNGSSLHLLGEFLNIKAQIKMVHVPYKGAAPAVTALLGGAEIGFMFSSIPPVLAHIKSQKVKAIAMATPKRSSLMPDIPTINEAGFVGVDAYSWNGVAVPTGTPAAAINRLHAELVKIMAMRDVIDKLGSQGAEAVSNTPAEFAAFIKSEIAKYTLIVKMSGATID